MSDTKFGDAPIKSEGAKLAFDPGEKIIVVVGPNCWGSGSSLQQAVAKARREYPTWGEHKPMPYNAYEASADFNVDEMGVITATKLTKIREVRFEGGWRITTTFPAGTIYREQVQSKRTDVK